MSELKWIELPVNDGKTLTWVLPNDDRQIWVRWVFIEDEKVHETLGRFEAYWPQFVVEISPPLWPHRISRGIELHTESFERVLAWAEVISE